MIVSLTVLEFRLKFVKGLTKLLRASGVQPENTTRTFVRLGQFSLMLLRLGIMLCYALVGISVALFYNITFFGDAVVPLPSPLVLSGSLMYYLAGFNNASPVAQVVLWIACFVLLGEAWQWVLIRLFGNIHPGRLAFSSLVLVLPLPWLLWVHGMTAEGLSLSALVDAILVRRGLYWNTSGSEATLNLLFMVLASSSVALELWLLHQANEHSAKETLGRWLMAIIGIMLATSALASMLYYGTG